MAGKRKSSLLECPKHRIELARLSSTDGVRIDIDTIGLGSDQDAEVLGEMARLTGGTTIMR